MNREEIPQEYKVRFKLENECKPANPRAQNNRSYELISPEGVAYRRNHRDKFQKKKFQSYVTQEESIDIKEPPQLVEQPEPRPGGGYHTRSGGEVRKPNRFQDDDLRCDFICYMFWGRIIHNIILLFRRLGMSTLVSNFTLLCSMQFISLYSNSTS